MERVDCSQLTPEQLQRMQANVLRQRDYLLRLIERMRVRRFPADDPVYRAALGAFEKTSNLGVVLAKCREAADGVQENVMSRRPWAGE
jgi:hypothetical protein